MDKNDNLSDKYTARGLLILYNDLLKCLIKYENNNVIPELLSSINVLAESNTSDLNDLIDETLEILKVNPSICKLKVNYLDDLDNTNLISELQVMLEGVS